MKATEQLYKLWMSKEYIELISHCNMILGRYPNEYLAYYYRALANEQLKDFDQAINDFKKSEETIANYRIKWLLKEYFVKIPIQISRVYLKLQNKEKVFEYADKAVNASEVEIDGLKWRATIREDFDDFLGASEDLNMALKRRPKDKDLIRLRNRMTYIIIERKPK